jgi:hypothetical protein
MPRDEPRLFAGSEETAGDGDVRQELSETPEPIEKRARFLTLEAELGQALLKRCFTCYHTV